MTPISQTFRPTFKAALLNESLFDQVTQWAREFRARPNDMALRMEIKHRCRSAGLPFPSFPCGNEHVSNPWLPLHSALENPIFMAWLQKAKRIHWHDHKGVYQYHVNCVCPPKTCNQRFDCSPMNIQADTLALMIQRTIKYRGELFVHNGAVRRCLQSKVEVMSNRLRLVQAAVKNRESLLVDIGE